MKPKNQTKSPATPKLQVCDLEVYPESLEAKRHGRLIKLRKKEFELLQFLISNRNRVVNKLALLEYVWQYDIQSHSNTLEVHMNNLRRKIDGKAKNKLIKTIYGAGYRLVT